MKSLSLTAGYEFGRGRGYWAWPRQVSVWLQTESGHGVQVTEDFPAAPEFGSMLVWVLFDSKKSKWEHVQEGRIWHPSKGVFSSDQASPWAMPEASVVKLLERLPSPHDHPLMPDLWAPEFYSRIVRLHLHATKAFQSDGYPHPVQVLRWHWHLRRLVKRMSTPLGTDL